MTTINGHVLPPSLVALLASRRWSAGHARRLDILPVEGAEDLRFLDEAGMRRETEALRDILDHGDAALFALHIGDLDQTPPPGSLAVNHAVVIAATHGEDGLALDYTGRTKPRVVASSADGTWIEVASDFDAFLALIQLDSR
jgi:hypothetical protein